MQNATSAAEVNVIPAALILTPAGYVVEPENVIVPVVIMVVNPAESVEEEHTPVSPGIHPVPHGFDMEHVGAEHAFADVDCPRAPPIKPSTTLRRGG